MNDNDPSMCGFVLCIEVYTYAYSFTLMFIIDAHINHLDLYRHLLSLHPPHPVQEKHSRHQTSLAVRLDALILGNRSDDLSFV